MEIKYYYSCYFYLDHSRAFRSTMATGDILSRVCANKSNVDRTSRVPNLSRTTSYNTAMTTCNGSRWNTAVLETQKVLRVFILVKLISYYSLASKYNDYEFFFRKTAKSLADIYHIHYSPN